MQLATISQFDYCCGKAGGVEERGTEERRRCKTWLKYSVILSTQAMPNLAGQKPPHCGKSPQQKQFCHKDVPVETNSEPKISGQGDPQYLTPLKGNLCSPARNPGITKFTEHTDSSTSSLNPSLDLKLLSWPQREIYSLTASSTQIKNGFGFASQKALSRTQACDSLK